MMSLNISNGSKVDQETANKMLNKSKQTVTESTEVMTASDQPGSGLTAKDNSDPDVLVSEASPNDLPANPETVPGNQIVQDGIHMNGTKSDERRKVMQRFTLYETASRFYLVGQDLTERYFRILKIDRTSGPGQLTIFEDENVYDKQSIRELIAAIEDGNKGSGGLKVKCTAYGLLGFIRFTEAYYMLLVTKRAQTAMLGGHYVYQIEATELVPLTTGSTSRFQRDRHPEEARYLGIFANIDLNKSFYFSYSYNITQTLQVNIATARKAVRDEQSYVPRNWNDMFIWNQYMLEPAKGVLKYTYDWCIPIIHGYIDQAGTHI
jgi:phosphatidylinositol 3,5-bisphosphate 5-phosphatase